MAAHESGFWTESDAIAANQFFTSESGTKLRSLLNNHVFKTCYDMVSKSGDHAYHAGLARGTALTVFYLQNQISFAPTQESAPEPSAPDAADQFADYGIEMT